MAETDQGSFYRKTLQFESHPVRQPVDMSHLPSVHIPPDSAEYLMPICNQGLCNCLTKSGRHSCYQNNHILQPLKNDCESRAQIYKNSMMISGTTIVWYGTQDSTIMDGRHTSGIFTVQTNFPPMLQLPVRAIIAICLRHILPSARESRSTVRPWLSWRISAQLVWRLD